MSTMSPDIFIDFSSELVFRTARSGGKGGQNVNKVETLVEAIWTVAESRFFSEEQKEKILLRLANKINSDGQVAVKSSKTRSQLENKGIAIEKILKLVNASLVDKAERKATKVPAGMKENRLLTKKRVAEKKAGRKKPGVDD